MAMIPKGRTLRFFKYRNIFLNTVINNFRIESRAYDKFGSGFYCLVYLLCCKDSSCSDQHIRIDFCHNADRLCCCLSTECYFRTWKASFYQSFCQRFCVFRII